MRRTLTALVLFSAALFILQAVPQRNATVVRGAEAQDRTMEQWVQTTVGDVESGEFGCLAIGATDGGELVLAEQEPGVYCSKGVYTSRTREMSFAFNVIGSAWLSPALVPMKPVLHRTTKTRGAIRAAKFAKLRVIWMD